MRKLIFISFLFFSSVSFSQSKDTLKIEKDSAEYEITVFNPMFNTWLITNAIPRGFSGLEYLEGHNRFYVADWNSRVGIRNRLYQFWIDYDSNVKYGYEVNYILFNYFQFFMTTTGERLGVRRRPF